MNVKRQLKVPVSDNYISSDAMDVILMLMDSEWVDEKDAVWFLDLLVCTVVVEMLRVMRVVRYCKGASCCCGQVLIGLDVLCYDSHRDSFICGAGFILWTVFKYVTIYFFNLLKNNFLYSINLCSSWILMLPTFNFYIIPTFFFQCFCDC